MDGGPPFRDPVVTVGVRRITVGDFRVRNCTGPDTVVGNNMGRQRKRRIRWSRDRA
jgi:hypothetical protein